MQIRNSLFILRGWGVADCALLVKQDMEWNATALLTQTLCVSFASQAYRMPWDGVLTLFAKPVYRAEVIALRWSNARLTRTQCVEIVKKVCWLSLLYVKLFLNFSVDFISKHILRQG